MDEGALETFDEAIDLDALAGGWFADDTDPHYVELPCYVPLDDEDNVSISPFLDEVPMDMRGQGMPRRAFRA